MNLYGFTLTFAIFLSYFLVRRKAPQYKISQTDLDNIFFIVIPLSIIGARIYHVLDKWSYYSVGLVKILYIWQGGLGIFGGLFGGLVGVLIYWQFSKSPPGRRRPKFSLLVLLDLIAPYLLLGQAIGRIGNFFNQEAFGPPTTLPWGIYIDPSNRPIQWLGFDRFHPTFFYEAAWDLIGFFVLLYLGKRFKDKRGFVFGSYLIVYGLGRFVVEFFRFDTAEIGHIKLAQFLSLVMVTFGIWFLGQKRRALDFPKETIKP